MLWGASERGESQLSFASNNQNLRLMVNEYHGPESPCPSETKTVAKTNQIIVPRKFLLHLSKYQYLSYIVLNFHGSVIKTEKVGR